MFGLRKKHRRVQEDCKKKGKSEIPTVKREDLPSINEVELQLSEMALLVLQDTELEKRVKLEGKIREGTLNLLSASIGHDTENSHPRILEAAKALLTSNMRLAVYMDELQQRKKIRIKSNDKVKRQVSKVGVSDLRMPLLWKNTDHFKNRGSSHKFCVFALFKIGLEIFDTVMVNPLDCSMTDICFDDIITFSNVPYDFECTMEVYSYLYEDESSKNIPGKLKSLHSSLTRSMGRRLSQVFRDGSTTSLGPKFELVATAKLVLNQISEDVRTHDLIIEQNVSSKQASLLPLMNHFCCRFVCQPDCYSQPTSFYAHVKESGIEGPAYCQVVGWRLEIWESKTESEVSEHHPHAISLDNTTCIEQLSKKVLRLVNKMGIDRGTMTLVFSEPESASIWSKQILNHCQEYLKWGKAAENKMDLISSNNDGIDTLTRTRKSLYDETILEGKASTRSEFSHTEPFYASTNYTAMLPPRINPLSLSKRSSFRRWRSTRASIPSFRTKS